MKRLRSLVVGSLLASLPVLGASSCGDDAPASSGAPASGATSSATGAGGGPSAIACEGAPEKLTLGGTWAAYGRLAVKLAGLPGGAITICPEDQIGESTMRILLTVKQDQADPTKLPEVQATLCSIELPIVTALVGACNPSSDTLVSTQIITPPPFIAALPKVPMMAVTGALSGTEDGSSLDFDRLAMTIGSTTSGDALASWKTDMMMCAAPDIGHTDVCSEACVTDCASLRDDDEDGYPGLTVNICGLTSDDVKKGVPCNTDDASEPGVTLQGRAFLNIEVNPKLTGAAESSCEVTGSIDTGVTYNVVGADVFLTGASLSVASVIKSLPVFTVDPKESRFRMIRVDGQYGAPDWGIDPTNAVEGCAAVLEHVNEL